MRCLLLVAASTLLGGGVWAAEEPAPEKAAKIGKTDVRVAVVDLTHVFENYRRSQLGEEKIRKALGPELLKLRDDYEEVKSLQATLRSGVWNVESPAYQEKREQYEKLVKELRRKEEAYKKEEANARGQLEQVVLDDFFTVLDEYCREHDIDVVLQHNEPKPTRLAPSRYVRQNTMLYFTPELDITEAVVGILNERHEAGEKDIGKARLEKRMEEYEELKRKYEAEGRLLQDEETPPARD